MDIKAIIIITSPEEKDDRFIPGDEWKDAWKFESDSLYAYRTAKNTTVQCCNKINEIPNNDFPIIIWVNTKKIQAKNLKNQLSKIINRLPEKIRVVYHDVLIDNIPENLHNVAKPYSLAKGNVSQFKKILKRKDDNYVFDTSASFKDIFSCFFLNLPKIFSILKHYIMTSFLDLDIDWQGIKEVNEKDKENAKEYLNDILKGKSNNYYCQKIVNLWFYLTGKNDLKIDDKVTTSLDKKDLPYEKSVLDLINELTKEIKENLEKRLRTLLKHVELENENKNKSEKVPSVIDYLKNLDKMIKYKKERDINKFLSFNFHKWYLKLGDLLDELKIFLE
jgi:hypothetical protein